MRWYHQACVCYSVAFSNINWVCPACKENLRPRINKSIDEEIQRANNDFNENQLNNRCYSTGATPKFQGAPSRHAFSTGVVSKSSHYTPSQHGSQINIISTSQGNQARRNICAAQIKFIAKKYEALSTCNSQNEVFVMCQ